MVRRRPTLDPLLWLLLCAAIAAAAGTLLHPPPSWIASAVAVVCCLVAVVRLWLRGQRSRDSSLPGISLEPLPILDPQEDVKPVLELFARATRAHRVRLLGPGRQSGSLCVAECWPETPDSDREYSAAAGILGTALVSGEISSAWEEKKTKATMAVPLAAPGGPWLVLLRRNEGAPFDNDDEQAARSASATLLRLVESGVAYHRASRRTRSLEWIVQTARELADADDLTDVATRCIEAVRRLVPVDVAVASVRAGDSDSYEVIVAEGVEIAAGAHFQDGVALAAQAPRRGAVLPAEGRYRRGHGRPFGDTISWAPREGAAFAVVPLEAGRGPVGSLLVSTTRCERYDAEARLALHSVGELAGAELQRRHLEKSLAVLARTDALTGLPNRRAFAEGLAAALQRSERYGHPSTLLMMDVDHFKKVNDNHGHPTGDIVLRQLGRLLREQAREVDIPGRLGGEEFALLLEHTPPEAALLVADRIRTALSGIPFEGPTERFQVTMSVGLAACPKHARDPEVLLKLADDALYEAKEAGRDRSVLSKIQRRTRSTD